MLRDTYMQALRGSCFPRLLFVKLCLVFQPQLWRLPIEQRPWRSPCYVRATTQILRICTAHGVHVELSAWVYHANAKNAGRT